MSVKVRTNKGTYQLNRDEFQRYMRNLWERAQARKTVREEVKQENENKGRAKGR